MVFEDYDQYDDNENDDDGVVADCCWVLAQLQML